MEVILVGTNEEVKEATALRSWYINTYQDIARNCAFLLLDGKAEDKHKIFLRRYLNMLSISEARKWISLRFTIGGHTL